MSPLVIWHEWVIDAPSIASQRILRILARAPKVSHLTFDLPGFGLARFTAPAPASTSRRSVAE